jgi:hypothetical protein
MFNYRVFGKGSEVIPDYLWTLGIYTSPILISSTFDHRTLRTRLPVRSALFKQRTGGLVVRWVTTSEYPLLNVFEIFLFASSHMQEMRRFFLHR